VAAFCGNTAVTRALVTATAAANKALVTQDATTDVHTDVTKQLDHRDSSGATALWLAASTGNTVVV